MPITETQAKLWFENEEKAVNPSLPSPYPPERV